MPSRLVQCCKVWLTGQLDNLKQEIYHGPHWLTRKWKHYILNMIKAYFSEIKFNTHKCHYHHTEVLRLWDVKPEANNYAYIFLFFQNHTYTCIPHLRFHTEVKWAAHLVWNVEENLYLIFVLQKKSVLLFFSENKNVLFQYNSCKYRPGIFDYAYILIRAYHCKVLIYQYVRTSAFSIDHDAIFVSN